MSERSASTFTRRLRLALPFVGSAALLAFMLSRLDLSGVASRFDLSVLTRLAPVFLAYGAVSLWLEALWKCWRTWHLRHSNTTSLNHSSNSRV